MGAMPSKKVKMRSALMWRLRQGHIYDGQCFDKNSNCILCEDYSKNRLRRQGFWVLRFSRSLNDFLRRRLLSEKSLWPNVCCCFPLSAQRINWTDFTHGQMLPRTRTNIFNWIHVLIVISCIYVEKNNGFGFCFVMGSRCTFSCFVWLVTEYISL